jgi:hypothetical protein
MAGTPDQQDPDALASKTFVITAVASIAFIGAIVLFVLA